MKRTKSDYDKKWTKEEVQGRRIVKTYDYTDEQGELLFQAIRYAPKAFRQRRPDNAGGYIWNLKETRRVLYRLPELIKGNDPVFICEGEKDTDNLREWGLTATCNPMGAEKWKSQQKEYNPFLKGRDVIILPDNDQEGFEHLKQVAASLEGIAKSVKVLRLPGAKDFSDWKVKDKNNTEEKFWSLAYDSEEWKEIREETEKNLSVLEEEIGKREGKKKELLQQNLPVIARSDSDIEEKPKYDLTKVILTSEEFLKLETPEKKTILSPWLKEKQIVLISGWRGVGKTWLALSLLDSITRNQSFGPWKSENPVNCLYLDAEMVKQDLDERLLMLNPDQERQSQLSIYSSELASIVGEPGPCLFDLAWQSLFKDFLLKNEIKLWVADNVTSLTPGLDENVKSEWDSVNEWLKQLRFAGITTILIHHLGKGGTQRGTSAREDNIDISIQLNHPAGYLDTDGCKFELKFTKTRIRQSKLKDISDLQLQLREDEKGQSIWTYGSIKKSIRNQILTLFDKGILNQSEIAEELHIGRAYVSRTKKQAITDKLITPGGKLTQSGFMETGKI